MRLDYGINLLLFERISALLDCLLKFSRFVIGRVSTPFWPPPDRVAPFLACRVPIIQDKAGDAASGQAQSKSADARVPNDRVTRCRGVFFDEFWNCRLDEFLFHLGAPRF